MHKRRHLPGRVGGERRYHAFAQATPEWVGHQRAEAAGRPQTDAGRRLEIGPVSQSDFRHPLARLLPTGDDVRQIDPNVLISSPVAWVVFLDATSGVK
jgi:hypothetical protein